MSFALRNFLHKGFESLFCTHAPEWCDIIAGLYPEVRDILIEDAATYSPEWAAQRDFDAAFFLAIETHASLQATLLYRLSRALYLRNEQHPALGYLAFLLRARTSMEIYYSTDIAPGFRIMHGAGTVIGPRHRIGRCFTVYQNVTLGQRRRGAGEFVTIGDDCTVYAGAKILGMVRMGDSVLVGANSVLLSDAESNSTYSGAPAVKVK